jgi:hypothetical protein
MKTFRDREAREWTVDISVDAIRRVKSLAKVDLMELLSEGAFIDKLIADPCLLVDILYVVCKPQADSRGVTDEQFGAAMGGDSLDDATSALLEDFCDFFPSRKREILKTALAKLKQIEGQVLTAAENAMNDPALDTAIKTALTKLASTQAAAVAAPQSDAAAA